MEIATLVYEQYLASKGIRKKAWGLARRALIKVSGDATCALPVHGRRLKLPLSHELPHYLQQHPFYDRLPQRISEYIHQQREHINCIDVGANIGDTIAAFYQDDSDIFLAIEPHPSFRGLLIENWGGNKNVTVSADMCSSDSDTGTFVIHEQNGTASIRQATKGTSMRRRPLDDIVHDHPAAMHANVLKIDTDGHDLAVIAGAKRLLSRNLPALLFECDAFENPDYVDDCLRTLGLLEQSGYNAFLLYDNFGKLLGRHSLADLAPFQHLLFFQLTSSFYYFDLLLMKDDDLVRFHRTELDYFAAAP